MCCNAFSLSSLISHAFSALCVYLKFGHHPHPLGYHCAKFCFFCGLHCWASPRRKITYSNTQSHSPSLFDVPGTEAFASELNRSYFMCWWWMCINWIFFLSCTVSGCMEKTWWFSSRIQDSGLTHTQPYLVVISAVLSRVFLKHETVPESIECVYYSSLMYGGDVLTVTEDKFTVSDSRQVAHISSPTVLSLLCTHAFVCL